MIGGRNGEQARRRAREGGGRPRPDFEGTESIGELAKDLGLDDKTLSRRVSKSGSESEMLSRASAFFASRQL